MKISKTLYVTNRDGWRAWLETNHDKEKEVWLIYYKKHTGKPRIPYDDAVEEALCFGWIDSIVKKLDEEKYIKKYSPRKDKSIWSDKNKERVKKMIKTGQMTKAGLTKIEKAKENGSWSKLYPISNTQKIPTALRKALSGDKKALENFMDLAPSYKKQFIWWILSAKGEETKAKRIREAIRLVSQNKKLGMK